MEASSNASSHQHIVAITVPLHGHAITLIRLSMKLASMGFTITFISTRSQLSALTQEKEAAAFISTKKIQFASVDDPDHLTSKESPFKQGLDGMALQVPEIDKLLQRAEIELNAPVCCILSDVMLAPFLGPIRDKRSSCQLVAVAVGCASFNLLDRHLGKRLDDGGINFSALPATIPDFPTRLSVADFPFILLSKTIASEFIESVFKHMDQANWIVINTFEELEGYALNALRRTYKLPVLSLGPLHISKGIEEEEDDRYYHGFQQNHPAL